MERMRQGFVSEGMWRARVASNEISCQSVNDSLEGAQVFMYLFIYFYFYIWYIHALILDHKIDQSPLC